MWEGSERHPVRYITFWFVLFLSLAPKLVFCCSFRALKQNISICLFLVFFSMRVGFLKAVSSALLVSLLKSGPVFLLTWIGALLGQ